MRGVKQAKGASMFDQYGNPINMGPMSPEPMPGPGATARTRSVNVNDMLGGTPANQPTRYRAPFFPTAPYYFTNPKVGYMVRFYSAGILNGAPNTELPQSITFDIPVQLIAINGSAFVTQAPNSFPVGVSPLDSFLFRMERANGEKLYITQRIASSILGTGQRPGELGGSGMMLDAGTSLQLGITPLLPNLRIDITLHCLELRSGASWVNT
jgi:hypothetical protein